MSAGRGDTSGQPSPQTVMGRRINLLLDAAAEKRGYEVLFPEVKTELAARGVGMSRARWFYMKDGTGPLVKNRTVLTAICGMFDVDPSYLLDLDSDELPESIQARLGFVKALRAARVQAFAARTLGDVSPETLNAITEFLSRDIPKTDDGTTGLEPSNN
ncbi:hypothetical protein [Arthrobacter sp. TWP1-1]|uniref:hypothetical protein n=1 Tax=Arthrobacter sp. TWP1-1 TaxID=2804568 RepID=UPI003CEAEB25